MNIMVPAYSTEEIEAIAGWLKQDFSASQIAAMLSSARQHSVSRNAIIGIVHRNKDLAKIGFTRSSNGLGGKRVATGTKQAQRERLRQRARPHDARSSFGPMTPGEKRAQDHPAYLPTKLFLQTVGDTSPDPAVFALRVGLPAPRPQPIIDRKTYDAGSRRLPLLDLKADQCRFPVNDAAPGEFHLFCGEATAVTESYCAHHAARCFAGFSARAA